MYTCIQNLSLHIIFVLSVTLEHLTFTYFTVQFNSVTQSYRTLRWHGLQHARLFCPSPTPRTCSNSSPSSQWCHPTISSSAVHFSCLQSFPVRVFSSESVIHMMWSKYWSFIFNIRASNEYSELISFRLTGLISLQSKGLSRLFSNSTVQKHEFFGAQPSL